MQAGGDYDGVIGMEKRAAMDRFLDRKYPFVVALTITLAGIIVESDNVGLATAVTLCAVVGFSRN